MAEMLNAETSVVVAPEAALSDTTTRVAGQPRPAGWPRAARPRRPCGRSEPPPRGHYASWCTRRSRLRTD